MTRILTNEDIRSIRRIQMTMKRERELCKVLDVPFPLDFDELVGVEVELSVWFEYDFFKVIKS